MKNTPFKMNGFSGFGNSPLKQMQDPFTRVITNPRIRSTNKRRKKSKLGYKVGRFFQKLLGGKGSRGYGSSKIGCGPRGC